MNIYEAARSGFPFTHPNMLGAWCFIDGGLYHRDNVDDFLDSSWVETNDQPFSSLAWFDPEDLLRCDWRIHTLHKAV